MLRRSIAGTLLPALLLGKAPDEDLHLAHGLLVASALGRRDALVPCGKRLVGTPVRCQCFAEHLPGGGIRGIELHRAPEMNHGNRGLAALEIFVSETEAKEGGVLPGREQALEPGQCGTLGGHDRVPYSFSSASVAQSICCIG